MRCGQARKHLYLNERQGSEGVTFPAEVEIAKAEEHLAECSRCRQFFSSEKRFKDLVISRLARESAPAELRERVATMLSRQRSLRVNPTRSSWIKANRSKALAAVTAVVLSIALAIALAMWLNGRRVSIRDRQLASTLIDDHAHTPPALAEITSSDHIAVESWFEGKIDFSFHLPPADDVSLTGGKLCNLQGRTAALIFYKHPPSRVSLFVLDGSEVDLQNEHAVRLDERTCVVDAMKGYNLVMWKERGVLYSLVSDIGSADLLQMAAQFHP